MMAFAKTENLDINQRISTVLWEISLEYPFITENEVFKIISLIDIVPEKICADDMIRRYYFILKAIGESNPNFIYVLDDMINTVNGEFHELIYQYLYEDMIRYRHGELTEFPDITKYKEW